MSLLNGPTADRPVRGTFRWLRVSIADYELVREWEGGGRRFVARPPARADQWDPVLVSELAVGADGWAALCDRLARLAQVPGDGLLRLIEVGPDLETGLVFVVTESAEPAPPPADRRAALKALATTARTLHAMHEAGLAYGPFTVDALLRTAHGTVLDLPPLDREPGVVLAHAGWAQLETTEPGVLGGESPSRASDIWGLGAVLHSLVSDRHLYPGIDEDKTVTAVQRVLFTQPEPDGRLPEPIARLVADCLRLDPADRPPSALVVAERLEEIGPSR